MNQSNQNEKKINIIFFVIIGVLVVVSIGLKLLIKDIKHNKDNWYFVEQNKYDYSKLSIDEYIDRGFLKKENSVVYCKEEVESLSTTPNTMIKVLINSKSEGEFFIEVESIKLLLNNKEYKISKWNVESNFFTFNAPEKRGVYNYTLEVMYKNTDIAKYKGLLKVKTSEEIANETKGNIDFSTISKDKLNEKTYPLEIIGLNSKGSLNQKIEMLTPTLLKMEKEKLYKKIFSNELGKLEYNVDQTSTINMLFAKEDEKFAIKENIDFKYSFIKDETYGVSEKKILVKNKNGVYYLDVPLLIGKYICLIESEYGCFYIRLNVMENREIERHKLIKNNKNFKIENIVEIQSLVNEILFKKLSSRIPNLDRIEVGTDLENKKINLSYYFKTNEIDPLKLHLTEDFNTIIKEDITYILFECIDGVDIIKHINFVNEGKTRLQHEQKYTKIEIKQVFDRI